MSKAGRVSFSEKTLAQLEQKLPHDVIRSRSQSGQQLSYVEGWYVIERANAVFGYDGWSVEVLAQTVLFSGIEGDKYGHIVRSHVRVRVGDVTRDGVGVGVGRARGPAEAIELAEKAAETDAQKRALRTFGASFGLALYDKEQEGVGPSRETLRLRDEVSRASDVDAWVRAHRSAVEALCRADQDEVRAAARARREALAAAAPSSGSPTAGPQPAPVAQAQPEGPEAPALAAFRAALGGLRFAGDGVAAWIDHRAALGALPVADRERAWGLLVARVEEVGQMKNAKVWLKRAIAEEDTRRASIEQAALTEAQS